MKFKIKHEIQGRIRIHVRQKHMTYEEADILLYYLHNLKYVTFAKCMNAHRMLSSIMWAAETRL